MNRNIRWMVGWMDGYKIDGWLDRYKLIFGCLGLDGYTHLKNR